ncbi:CDP-diacylglycerol--glycerol-3-phosphate 3-phosphatidyltransferase [Kineococcus rhizosphaerae]|uniref:CDP-diacylglycerol--glycerol-3-phosphate 3-phosphatidyltransferase n=1 Tax=Kineococcus rhizosphaerae TaxID=559628 RepID=A0A2T0RBH0_9ACTN|nr:CDP-diacylglycerol--glycerol-3-phosphate 3-phosphatidyltransferase [Kineococcus rhizosphaerae]
MHRGHVPNALTVLRLVFVPVFVWFLWTDGGQDWRWRTAAAAVFIAASITDRYDGHLARRWEVVSDFGKIADPIADKALIGAGLVVLSLQGRLWWWMTAVILARELLVTLLRFIVIRRGVIPAAKGGKIKTVVQTVAVGLFVLPLPAALDPLCLAVMAVAVVLTIWSAWAYFVAGARLLRP